VLIETWERWREDVEREGIRFAPAPEYHVFPTEDRPLKPYEAVRRATVVTRDLVRAERPDVVVADILTLAPALAAELEGVPWATLVPHFDPRPAPGLPPFSVGARLPRTALGRRFWGLFDPLIGRGLELGRVELNETRRRLGLPPLAHAHGGISRRLAMVATFPQLEYARPAGFAPGTHVVGPLLWEPASPDVELPRGDPSWPVVLLAPSTAQDREHRMLRSALAGLAGLPVRVLASTNRCRPDDRLPTPPNARLVDWLSYSRAMPQCDLVVCHVGHGTLARAMVSGVPLVACPAAGDMNECAARIDWLGAGVRLPRRLITARGLRLAVERALGDPGLTVRARELAAWATEQDPAGRAAELVEDLAARG
jgi:UDP:flavonoid glycosyltransferase YjiC (YdhE family)